MNDKYYEQLVSRYLAGNSDGAGSQDAALAADLLAEVKQNPELLDYLAQHRLIQRLIPLELSAQSTDIFVKELCLRVNEPAKQDFSDQVALKLNQTYATQPIVHKKHFIKRYLAQPKLFAVAASCLVATLIWFLLPTYLAPETNYIAKENRVNEPNIVNTAHTAKPQQKDDDDNQALGINLNSTDAFANNKRSSAEWIGVNLADKLMSTDDSTNNQLTSPLASASNTAKKSSEQLLSAHLSNTQSSDIQSSDTAFYEANKLRLPQSSARVDTSNATNQLLSASTNLLEKVNGDFELANLTYWRVKAASSGYAEVRREAAKMGEYGLYVNTQAGAVYLSIDYPHLPQAFMQTGRAYKLSFDIKKLRAEPETASIFARFSNTFSESEIKETPIGPWFTLTQLEQWQHVEKTILGENWPASHTNLEIGLYTAEQEFYVDNVQLVPIIESDNLLVGNAGLEQGHFGQYLVEKIGTGYDNYAQVEVREEAAITGRYGLYVNSLIGDLALKFNYKAIDQNALDTNRNYVFSYDMRLIEGDASIINMTTTGWRKAIPGWPPNSYNLNQGMFNNTGLIHISMTIPKASITDDKLFELSLHMPTGAIVHLDNFKLYPEPE